MEKKFELTNEKKHVGGVDLYRIKYLRSVHQPEGSGERVKAGELGGWVENERNLDQEGEALILNEAIVIGKSRVTHTAWVMDRAVIVDSRISGDSLVADSAKVHSGLVTGGAHVLGSARIISSVAKGDAKIRDEALLTSGAIVDGDTCLSGKFAARGPLRISLSMPSNNPSYAHSVELSGGSWGVLPLMMHGAEFDLRITNYDTVSIGCQTHNISYWLENYKSIGEDHDFTNSQIVEYGMYLSWLSEWLRMQKAAGKMRRFRPRRSDWQDQIPVGE